MSVIVNTNVSSILAQNNLSKITTKLQSCFEKLSTGYQINSAKDDAAGLAISENLQSQIDCVDQASDNAQTGISILQIAEGSMTTILSDLQRVRNLSVQAANATNGSEERDALLQEIKQRVNDIDQTAKTSSFNGLSLLTGTLGDVKLLVGAGNSSTNTIDVSNALVNLRASALGIDFDQTATTGTVWTEDKVDSFINVIDAAISTVTSAESNLGSYQNRLSRVIDNLDVMDENCQSSNSTIRDVDIAQETSDMTRYQIMQQMATSVLTQANQLPELAMSLLNG